MLYFLQNSTSVLKHPEQEAGGGGVVAVVPVEGGGVVAVVPVEGGEVVG